MKIQEKEQCGKSYMAKKDGQESDYVQLFIISI